MQRKLKKINYKKHLHLQPIRLEDFPFLQQVYGSTRKDILNHPTLAVGQKNIFIQQQFQAQHLHYQQHYQGANFDRILLKKQPIGRFYVHRQVTEIRIIDIALLPKYHNQGMGTFLLNAVLEEGSKENKIVSLHVEKKSPALKLYERLGFKRKKEVGMRFFMEWKP